MIARAFLTLLGYQFDAGRVKAVPLPAQPPGRPARVDSPDPTSAAWGRLCLVMDGS